MLIFTSIIFLIGPSASFPAKYYENTTCIDKCMELTTTYGEMERYLKCLSTCMADFKKKHPTKRLINYPERIKTKVEENLWNMEERLDRVPTGNMNVINKQYLGFPEKRPEISGFPKSFRKNEALDSLLGSMKTRLKLADVKKKLGHNVSEVVDGIKDKIYESIDHLIDIPRMVAQGYIQNGDLKFDANDNKRNLNKKVSLNGYLAPKSNKVDMAVVSEKFKRQVPYQFGNNYMGAPQHNRPVVPRLPAARARFNMVPSPGQRAFTSDSNGGRLIGNNFYSQRRTAAAAAGGGNTGAGGQERARFNGGLQDGDGIGLNGNIAGNTPAAGSGAGDQFGVANGAGRADTANRLQNPTYGKNEAGNREYPRNDYDRFGDRAMGRFSLRNPYKSSTNQYGATERNTYGAGGPPRNNFYRNDGEQPFYEGHAILSSVNPRNSNPMLTNSNQYGYSPK